MKLLGNDSFTYLWEKITKIFATKAELNAIVGTIDIPQYVICTLSEYNAMQSHDSETYYIIISESNAQS